MTEIPKKDLHKYIGKEIVLKEGTKESNVIFTEYSGWLKGFNITDHSFIEVLMTGKESENGVKYFIK